MSRSQSHATLVLSILATAALTANRFVSAVGAVATAAGNAVGVTRSDAAVGALAPVTTLGTEVITAGGAIAKGAAIEVGTAGKGVTRTAGVTVARALEAAAADGDQIEVLLIPN